MLRFAFKFLYLQIQFPNIIGKMVAIYTLLVFIGSQSPFKVLQHGGQTARGPHPRPQRYLHFAWSLLLGLEDAERLGTPGSYPGKSMMEWSRNAWYPSWWLFPNPSWNICLISQNGNHFHKVRGENIRTYPKSCHPIISKCSVGLKTKIKSHQPWICFFDAWKESNKHILPNGRLIVSYTYHGTIKSASTTPRKKVEFLDTQPLGQHQA